MLTVGEMFQGVLMCSLRWTWGINQHAELQQHEHQQEDKEGEWPQERQQDQQQQQQMKLIGRAWTQKSGNTTGLAPFLLPPLRSALLLCGADPMLELEEREWALPRAVIRAVKGFRKVAQEVAGITSSSSSNVEGSHGGGHGGSSSSSSTRAPMLVTRDRLALLVQLLQCLVAVQNLFKASEYDQQISRTLLLLSVLLRVSSLEVQEEFSAGSDGKELLRILLALLLEDQAGQGLTAASSTSTVAERQQQQQLRRQAGAAPSSSTSDGKETNGDRGTGGSGDMKGSGVTSWLR
jgi:hypothetical protein